MDLERRDKGLRDRVVTIEGEGVTLTYLDENFIPEPDNSVKSIDPLSIF